MKTDLPSPELLRKLLRYDLKTGKLFWRERPVEMFADGRYGAESSAASWNTRYAGKEAFTTDDGDGYKIGDIFGRKQKAHRVIWAMTHDEWPKANIDHINGIRHDNRIENMRVVTQAENLKNQKRRSNNTSGVTGVSLHKPTQKWVVRIKGNGNYKNLGRFTDFNEAVAARKAAEGKYGFHENHGRAG